MSPDSMDVAAEMGAAMATFVQFPIEQHAPLIQSYQDKFRAAQGHDAPPPTLTEFVYCGEDADEAAANGQGVHLPILHDGHAPL